MLVFDASTLILVARIDLLGKFLAHISIEVVIPAEVERECCEVKKTLDALMIEKAIVDSRIRVRAVKNRKLVTRLQTDFSLGQGEAEAITLAVMERSPLLAIDDKNGINACKLLGVAFTTAAGILMQSRENQWISDSEAHAMLALLAKYGRYKNSIIEDIKDRLEAGK